MSTNKRYYWLKLNEDFFEDDTINWLEEQENGKEYVIFYLKLCLKSLKDDGKLIRYIGSTLMPYDVKALSRLTSTPPDTVAVAMEEFFRIGLVSRLHDGEIYMNQINEMIGSETDVAKRVRQHRARKVVGSGVEDKLLQSNADVTKGNTEIEIEIDKELDKEIYTGEEKPLPSKLDDTPYKEVVSYLNEQTGSKYRSTTAATKKHIKARTAEGFTLEDFKRVIDNKTHDWLHDQKMKKFLRPETLFGSKFEGYLNESAKKKHQNDLSDEELDALPF